MSYQPLDARTSEARPNLEMAVRIIDQQPIDDIDFLTVTDPKTNESTILSRLKYIRRGRPAFIVVPGNQDGFRNEGLIQVWEFSLKNSMGTRFIQEIPMLCGHDGIVRFQAININDVMWSKQPST